jgi:TonB family protein
VTVVGVAVVVGTAAEAYSAGAPDAQVKVADVLIAVAHRYPDLAFAGVVTGRVELEAEVDAQGVPTSIRTTKGHVLFDDAALAAAREWRFRPVAGSVRRHPMKFTFRLLDSDTPELTSGVRFILPSEIEVAKLVRCLPNGVCRVSAGGYATDPKPAEVKK